jgi:hypothetical protein
VIDEATRARDDHVDTALERGLLDRQVDTAERRAHVQARVASIDAQVLCNLHAQLARRHEDHAARTRFTAAEAIEHRQAERGGLAAAGLAEADQVSAGEDLGDGVRLDVGRRFVASCAHTAEDGLLEPEGTETH